MSDEYLVSQLIPPSVRGLLEGVDPALPEEFFPITAAQDLLNCRVSAGKWQTRAAIGSALAVASPNSGACRFFDTLYEADGGRFRLIARGEDNAAKLFDFEVGVDSVWQAVSGGTGLGTTTSDVPYFHGSQVGEAFYISDRFGALRKYVTAGTLAAVTIPAAPGTAPRVKARTYATLEAWTGGGTMGWTESDSGNFDIADGSSEVAPPMGTGVGKITISGTGARGDFITKDVASQELASHAIAFFYYSNASIRKHLSFGFGTEKADEFTEIIWAPAKQDWVPVFINVGNLPSINRKRFKAIRALTSQTFYVSEMFLPGRLEGFYRWGYTHYNPTTGHESGLSPVSNDGEAMDFSSVGVSRGDGQAATKAFQKSAMLDFTSDSGTDAATTKIRIYRSGGVPELTTGPDGRSIWLRVGEINDTATELAGAHSSSDTTLAVDSDDGFATDDWIVIAKGTSTEEYQKVASVAGDVLTVTPGLLNNQSDNATIQIAFLDNTGNEAIDVLSTVDEERDSPPDAAQWVQRAPDGKVWLFFTEDGPTSIAVSNRPTPLRPNDQECFPDDVDPFTRANPTQGWRFAVGADSTGETGVWGGFYRGLPHVLTRNKMFRVHALSQTDWGANAVQKVLDIGCIAGETVQQCDGYLYWVAEGPRVVRWDGQGPVEVLSAQRVNERLRSTFEASGTANAIFWFARCYETVDGKYYSLWFDYSGTLGGCLKRLDYNITHNLWEPCQWFDGNGSSKAWNRAVNWDGGADDNALVGVTYRGELLKDVTNADTDSGSVPISFLLKTKRIPLGFVSEIRELYIRLAAETDELTVTVRAGGSDYGDTSGSYEVSTAGSGDLDLRVPVERTVKGRWCEIEISGNVSNRPGIREMTLVARPIRERTTANT